MKEIYKIEIQDGENTYCEYITNKNDIKNITTIKVTDKEYEILEKLKII